MLVTICYCHLDCCMSGLSHGVITYKGELNIKTAEELYKITLDRRPEIVERILVGVREHIIERCEEEANRGNTQYTIYLIKTCIHFKHLCKNVHSSISHR